MKFKKTIWAVLAVFILAAATAGCGGNQQAKPKELLFATGGTAGTYYPLGGAMAQVWNEKGLGIHVTVQSTGASVENMRLLDKKAADMALAINNVADDAYNGKGEFKDKPVKDFKAVGVVYSEAIQGFVNADSDIKAISGLKGKKVAVGPTGSGTAVTTKIIFKNYGLDFSEIQPIYATFADAVDQFKDKHVDSAWNVLAVPAAAIQDVSTMRKIRFINIEGPEMQKLIKDYPLFAPYEIPANTYPGQDKPVKTVSLQSVLYVRADMDEDMVYKLTKSLYEDREAMAKNNVVAKQIDLKRAASGVTTPFHPGALKYFKEKGIQVP